MSEVRTGKCACGAVSFELRGPVREVFYCHCESCRRQTTNYVAATSVPIEDVTVSGAGCLSEWQATPDAVRKFCRICGSLMFWQRIGADTVSVMAGTIDEPTGLKAALHMYAAEKGDYYDLCDGLPVYAIEPEPEGS